MLTLRMIALGQYPEHCDRVCTRMKWVPGVFNPTLYGTSLKSKCYRSLVFCYINIQLVFYLYNIMFIAGADIEFI